MRKVARPVSMSAALLFKGFVRLGCAEQTDAASKTSKTERTTVARIRPQPTAVNEVKCRSEQGMQERQMHGCLLMLFSHQANGYPGRATGAPYSAPDVVRIRS